MNRPIAVIVLAASIGCAASTIGPLTVRLQYTTAADPVDFPLLQACAAVSAVQASDSRGDSTLGTRFLEKAPNATHQVMSSGDVVAWARSGAEQALRRAQMEIGKSSAPILQLAVENIVTEETVFRRAEYDARVALLAELHPAKGEPPCWQERVEGSAENYGYAGSTENYQETVNHALDRAMIRVLNSDGFKNAVCSCAPKSGL